MTSVTIPVARPEEAEALQTLSLEAFASAFELYGGYPPGLESLKWHREQIGGGHCHKILSGEDLIGGAYLLPHPNHEMKLDFFFIGTKHQGKKIGSHVLGLLEKTYPDVKKWFLSTPYKDYGNHHLYEKHGYVKTGESRPDENSDFKLFEYEKQM